MAKNVLGTDLAPCSTDPMTGFLRNGRCETCAEDAGMHTICCEMTEAFLSYTRRTGNDLSTPNPEIGFPGLVPGDRWCVCVNRWIEAWRAGVAPRVKLSATHMSVLEFVDLGALRDHAIAEDADSR
jgi:uncharacterized protein